MKKYSMALLRSGALLVCLKGVFLWLPALAQASNITCNVEIQGEENILQCLNNDGTPARLQPPERGIVNLEFGLTLLGCAVPTIDGDLSDADEAIACVQDMFGLTPGPLSREESVYISAAGRVVRSRERALRYMATRGYFPVAARVAQSEAPQSADPQEPSPTAAEHGSLEAQPADRVQLYFPEIGSPPPGKRTALHQGRFFNIVYDAPLLRQEEVLMTNLQPNRRTQRSPHAEAHFLSQLVNPVALLLDPADSTQGSVQDGTLRRAWQEELYKDGQHKRLFTAPVMEALAEAPPVLKCAYDQYSAAPPDDRNFLSTFRVVRLAFWTGLVRDAISPQVLREFGGPGMGMHPLIMIGPQVETCPENLGIALEVMATQFPSQVAAADPSLLDDLAESSAVTTESGPDLSYLPRSTARYFMRILEGDARAGNSAGNKIGVYLAFHRAFASTCPAEMGDDWEEYTFTRDSERLDLRETETIRLNASDFDQFYLAASLLVPVVIMEYEEDPTKDFGSLDPNDSIPEIYAIRVQTDAENQAAFSEILNREGCGSDFADELRTALSANLPQMTAYEGESTVSIYFQSNTGARSMNVMLDAPYAPTSMRATKVISGSDAGQFPLGSDYGGRMLSYIALGDFAAARTEQRKSSDEVIRQLRAMGPAGPNPVADFYEWGFRNSANFDPFTQVITSYIIRRVQILGSCGDPMVPIVRNYVEIETTRNGFGTEIGSREVGRYSREAVVPVAFKPIVERAEDITPGMFSRELVDGAIDKLSCESEIRGNLEANMIAFNSGADPVWINPEIGRTLVSDEKRSGMGQSAYIYTNADAAINLIQDAARNNDPRLSLRYELPDDTDRSDAQMNLLLVGDIPAMVFDTSYFGQKPGVRTPGRLVRMIMSCAATGDLDISQFLSSTESNDLDPDAIYNLTYSAYGLNGKWPMTARLESEITNSNSFTFARFRGRMVADDNTFAGLRPTSNFISSLPMPNGNNHLSFGVDAGRVNTTLAPLLDHCRSIEAP